MRAGATGPAGRTARHLRAAPAGSQTAKRSRADARTAQPVDAHRTTEESP
ncbi:hypothetical protein GA0115240_156331 [Streptomyces sp. DvalAA-14]|nr:hypothetical protein GA0115240_156331 [Streptomyces sp. DvalAA-14]